MAFMFPDTNFSDEPFFALFLMFLAGATAPRNDIFVAALILLAGWRLWRDSASTSRQRWHFFFLALGALGLVGLFFMCMIHFRIAEFWRVFHVHAQLVTGLPGQKRSLSALLRHHFGIMQQVLLALGGVMFYLVFRGRSDRLVHIGLAIGAAFPIAFFTNALGHGVGSWNALLVILFLSAALLKRSPRAGRVVLSVALGSLFLWLSAPDLVQVFGILSGKIQPDQGEQYNAARALTSTPQHQLFVDPSVARYTFDYKTPRGCIDFWFAAPFTWPGGALTSYQPQDIYLLSPDWRDFVERNTYLEHQPRPKWSWFGLSFDRFPRKVFIVPAESCKAVKSETANP